ncbi:hypothetical protein D3C77_710300 [compost metagenome]
MPTMSQFFTSGCCTSMELAASSAPGISLALVGERKICPSGKPAALSALKEPSTRRRAVSSSSAVMASTPVAFTSH